MVTSASLRGGYHPGYRIVVVMLRILYIVIDDAGNPLISDFGLSRLAETVSTRTPGADNSLRWLAPELLRGDNLLTLSSDIYSYGMTVLELFTHERPWSSIPQSVVVIIQAIQGLRPPRPMQSQILERGLDVNCWALVEHCWAQSPEERPTIQEILSSLP
ncbi:kinase-like domain-containing protein [Mycena alexandri]|uniref:Kinase-like domain-containing protein n=1 Tax=Mycena alexandri TaxID=1745969 RepID=A0AAD6SS82_9AGAR|nr:kinase-like domain-containing protein [Mycena alexandri]